MRGATSGARSATGTRTRALRALVAGLCFAGVVLGAPGVGHASASQFCKANLALGRSNGRLANLNAGGDPPSRADFVKAASAAKKLVGEAPTAIKHDVSTVADALSNAAKNGTAAWTSRKTQAAAARVSRWVDKNC